MTDSLKSHEKQFKSLSLPAQQSNQIVSPKSLECKSNDEGKWMSLDVTKRKKSNVSRLTNFVRSKILPRCIFNCQKGIKPISQERQSQHLFITPTACTTKYTRLKLLSNTTDPVFLVLCKQNKKLFIMKQISIEKSYPEITILKQIDNSNVINLRETVSNKTYIYAIIEHIAGGCLMEDSRVIDPFPPSLAATYFSDLIEAVTYLQSMGIVHNDIKPSNCLVTEKNKLILSDFGNAYFLKEGSHACCTPAFSPPELNSSNPYFHYCNDIWSCGVTLYMLLTGNLPFEGENVLEIYENILYKELEVPPDIDFTFTDLLQKILEKDHLNRITAEEIIDHPYKCKYIQKLDAIIPMIQKKKKNACRPYASF